MAAGYGLKVRWAQVPHSSLHCHRARPKHRRSKPMKYLCPGKICLIVSTIVLLTSCPAPTQQATPTITLTLSPVPTLKPTNTVVPTATSIPGFEDWSVFNPQVVAISTENDSLILTLRHRAL